MRLFPICFLIAGPYMTFGDVLQLELREVLKKIIVSDIFNLIILLDSCLDVTHACRSKRNWILE